MERTSVPVAEVTSVGPAAIALEFETPEDFEAKPGQFVKLIAAVDGEEESRFYTISSPTVADSFELTIEIDPDGAVSPILTDLEAGDELLLSGPYGNAYYEGEAAVTILAGGPGIGPAVGIAERAIADGGSATVIYRDDDPIHEERLGALEADGVTVRILEEDADLAGAIDAEAIADAQVFVYGFVDFLDEAMDAIASAGGDPEAAKVENFG